MNSKMMRLVVQLADRFGESAKVEGEIWRNLVGVGYAS